MTLHLPWTLIDPDGASGGILARIVTDREMGHVAVFDDPETARTVVETMNRAESAEQERRELEAQLELSRSIEVVTGRCRTAEARVQELERELAEARDARAVLAAMAKEAEKP